VEAEVEVERAMKEGMGEVRELGGGHVDTVISCRLRGAPVMGVMERGMMEAEDPPMTPPEEA